MRKCKLGDILQFQRGYDLPINDMIPGNYPVIGSSGINGWHNEYTTEAPSLSVGRSGNSAGKAFIYYGKTWTHNTALFVKEFKDCVPTYAYYLLKAINLSDYATGSAVPTLNRNHIHDINVTIHDIEQQEKIGNFLKSIDDKIAVNEKKITTLESLSKTLYDYYFLQFDFPDEKGRPYKSSGGKMEYNAELGREIPAGWKVVPINDLVDCNANTATVKTIEYPVNYLDTSNITQNVIDTIQVISTPAQLPIRARRIIKNNDIIISTVRPNLKHYGFIKCLNRNVIVSTGYAVLSPKNQAYSSYIYQAVTSDEIQKTIDQIAQLNVSAYPSFNPSDLLNLKIAIPNCDDILYKFSGKLNKFYEIISKKQQENRHLTALRDFLLPLLMNGQVGFKK